VACRATADQARLLRFAKTSQGGIQADPERVVPGCGAYLHPTAECVAAAAKARSLERALQGSLPEGWVNSVVLT